jgi:hypothetical protein
VAVEVDQKAESEACCFEVVVDLGAVNVGERGDGLDFDHNLPKADEVGLKHLHKPAVLSKSGP